MFVGLTISNLEPESLVTALHRPLLNSEEHEVCKLSRLSFFICIPD